MSDSPRLSSAPPERLSLDYAGLREAGLERIRQLAGRSWTDHNSHDPGITLLEAFSYAMTELGLRLQLDMGDLLRSGAALAPAELPAANRVLPVAAVSADDLRRVVLDHPLVEDALIRLGAPGEVAFYENPAADPPFSYQPGGPPPLERVRLEGLYEVVTAFADSDLDSNTYALAVALGPIQYLLELALPPWDEAPAAPFRAGAKATGVTLLESGKGGWRPLTEPLSFFGDLEIAHDGAAPNPVRMWAVLRIVDALAPADPAIPALLAEVRTRLEANAPDGPLALFADRVRKVQQAVGRLERLLAATRNLGQDPVSLKAARIQEIAVSARLEITGGADLETLLADIFTAIDRQLSPTLQFHPLAELLARGREAEQIFDGPLLRQGFLDRDELAGFGRATAIYASDLLRLILPSRAEAGAALVAQENPAGRDVVALTDLRLSSFVNNRPVTTNARDCLRLVEVERYRPRLSVAKSRLVLVRDDIEVPYDRARVQQLVRDRRELDRAGARPASPPPALPEPPGELLPIGVYTPFQFELPQVYGLGEAGLAPAGAARRAQQLQAKAYLHFFEQLLADHTAQLANINRYFSPRADESASYFVRPLFDLPEVAEILKAFPPGSDWEAFVADPANPHRLALAAAAEDRDRLLDRRNRMLDHLLARLGEETVALGQELHRQARVELMTAGLAAAELEAATAARRGAVNARLVAIKAAFLAEAPELAARRLQGFGAPWQGAPAVATFRPEGDRWRFELAPGGAVLLRSLDGAGAPESRVAAELAAEEALLVAGSESFYGTRKIGPVFFYFLRDGERDLARSPGSFPSSPAAKAALQDAAARFAELRLARSLTPLERRVRHLSGLRGDTRRPLVVPDQLFTVTDTAAGDGVVEGWELRGEPGGPVLLASAGSFSGADDAEALAKAREAIAAAARFGLDEWSWALVPAALGQLGLELRAPSGAVLGRPPAAFAGRAAAEAALATLVGLLHRDYGVEGFHLVDHLLLRPRQNKDTFLGLPGEGGAKKERSPYNHRLSLVFPSGYQRDFSLAGSPRLPAAPHRMRDPELRRHLERTVRQACPAHLLPTLLFVDRDIQPPGSGAPGSFDHFERRYFTWLRTILIPGASPTAQRAARNELAGALNAVANG